MYDNPWFYQFEPFTTDKINGYYGFVYILTNELTGKMYVGRKYFFSKKGSKLVESDWKTYYGSSKEVAADVKIHGAAIFKRRILSLHLTKGLTNYAETKELFAKNVLEEKTESGERRYYNGNILSRYFAATIESSKRSAESQTGSKRTEATRRKISEALKGKKPSDACLAAVKIANKKPKTAEFKAKISEVTKGDKNPMFGHRHTDASKQKMSLNRSGISQTLEQRKKMSERLKGNTHRRGKKLSDETKKKLSSSSLGRRKSDSTKKKMSDAAKRRWASTEKN